MDIKDKTKLKFLLQSYIDKIDTNTLERKDILLLSQFYVNSNIKLKEVEQSKLLDYMFMGMYIYENMK